MRTSQLLVGIFAAWVANLAQAQAVNLGVRLGDVAVGLPIVEGGLLGVAAIGLVAGIRIVQRKQKRK